MAATTADGSVRSGSTASAPAAASSAAVEAPVATRATWRRPRALRLCLAVCHREQRFAACKVVAVSDGSLAARYVNQIRAALGGIAVGANVEI